MVLFLFRFETAKNITRNVSFRIMRSVLLILCLLVVTKAAIHNNYEISSINLVNVPGTGRELKRYKPEWSDLDKRPLPRWYDEAKVGIFLHWGVYSVPSFGSEWFWINWKIGTKKYVDFMKKNYAPGFAYQDFAPMFTAEFFDADAWAKLFAKSGAKYIVLTSKHHEGFTLFPSKKSFSWNSVDVGPRRDLVGELAMAVREHDLKFGVYHSLFEWFNPIYLEDKKHNFTQTQTFVDTKLWPDLKQLIHDYEPSVIWSDGDWEAYDRYWKSEEFLAWLYNDSPVKDEVVVNDRWGIGTYGKHGDFFNFADRFNNRTIQKHKWENAFTVDTKSWGYRRNIDINEVVTACQLIEELVTTVSCGGNVLINVGPTKEGTIIPIFQERLLSLGTWLSLNGEAIYGSSPWSSQNDTLNGNVWYTCIKSTYNAEYPTAKARPTDDLTAIYAIVLKWPSQGVLPIRDITPYLHSKNYKAELLAVKGNIPLTWFLKNGVAQIRLPSEPVASNLAWTLKFSHDP